MTKKPDIEIMGDGADIFIVRNGVRIAKRGHPGTPHAKTWVPLEPGFVVRDADDQGGLTIEFNGIQIH